MAARVRDIIRWLKKYDQDQLVAFAEDLSDRYTFDFDLKFIDIEDDEHPLPRVLAFVIKDF